MKLIPHSISFEHFIYSSSFRYSTNNMNPDLTQASLGASARDTCASINRRANCKLLKEGLLFIGDSLAYATDLEVDLLRSKHELATVIDTHPADDTQSTIFDIWLTTLSYTEPPIVRYFRHQPPLRLVLLSS